MKKISFNKENIFCYTFFVWCLFINLLITTNYSSRFSGKVQYIVVLGSIVIVVAKELASLAELKSYSFFRVVVMVLFLLVTLKIMGNSYGLIFLSAMLFVISARDVDFEKILKTFIVTILTLFAITIGGNKLGTVGSILSAQDGRFRNSMVFSYVSFPSQFAFFLTAAYLVWRKRQISNIELLILLGVDIYIYKNTLTTSPLIDSKLVDPKKIKVIYNGVDSSIFSPDIETDYLMQEWKVPKDAVKVGVIGRLNAWKGQNDFLDATETLLDEYENLYLFVIGSPFADQEWRTDELKKRIAQNKYSDRIIFSEFRKDNATVHNFLDILVLPSTNPDPLPTVVLEAMASGKPVVGYAHGGICEMVVDGKSGSLAKVNDPTDLSVKINELVSSREKRVRFGSTARKRQLENFSLGSFIEKFEEMYGKL